MIFLGLKFWPKVIFFGPMKDLVIFLDRVKKQRDFLGLQMALKHLSGILLVDLNYHVLVGICFL